MKAKYFISLIPSISLAGLMLSQYFYNSYLNLAASQMNYNYKFMCILKLISAIWFLITITYFLRSDGKVIKSIIIVEIIQIVLLISMIIISSYNVILYNLVFDSIEYLFLWCMVIVIQVLKQVKMIQ